MNKPNIEVTKIREYTGHKGSIYSMILSDNQESLFTAGDDGIVARWELNSEENHAKAILQTDRGVYGMAFLPGNRLAIGTSNGIIYFVNLADNSVLKTLQQSTTSVYGMKVIGDNLWILHGGGWLSILRLEDYSQVFYQKIAENHLRSIETFGENIVFIGSSDYKITAIDPKEIKPLYRWQAHDNTVFSLAVHQEGKYLLSGGRDAYLNVWDLNDSQKRLQNLPAHNFTINDIAISPSGNHFATASRDKSLKLWDSYTFDLLKVVDFARNTAHTHSVNKIKWLKSDNSLISCSDDRRIIRWKFGISNSDRL